MMNKINSDGMVWAEGRRKKGKKRLECGDQHIYIYISTSMCDI